MSTDESAVSESIRNHPHTIPFFYHVESRLATRSKQVPIRIFILRTLLHGVEESGWRRHVLSAPELYNLYIEQHPQTSMKKQNFHYHIKKLRDDGFIVEVDKIKEGRHLISYYGRVGIIIDDFDKISQLETVYTMGFQRLIDYFPKIATTIRAFHTEMNRFAQQVLGFLHTNYRYLYTSKLELVPLIPFFFRFYDNNPIMMNLSQEILNHIKFPEQETGPSNFSIINDLATQEQDRLLNAMNFTSGQYPEEFYNYFHKIPFLKEEDETTLNRMINNTKVYDIFRYLYEGIEDEQGRRHALSVREIHDRYVELTGDDITTQSFYTHINEMLELGVIKEIGKANQNNREVSFYGRTAIIHDTPASDTFYDEIQKNAYYYPLASILDKLNPLITQQELMKKMDQMYSHHQNYVFRAYQWVASNYGQFYLEKQSTIPTLRVLFDLLSNGIYGEIRMEISRFLQIDSMPRIFRDQENKIIIQRF